MKRLINLGLIVIFLNVASMSSYASLMGSDMAWSCLGGDSFLIKIAVYSDCNGAAMGNITINFYCSTTGTSVATLSLTAPTPVDITPVCNNSCTRCQSSSCSFPYGVNKYLYQGIVHLNSAGSCCNIRMSYSLGARSSAITTGAAGANFYSEAMMNRCQNPCDYSPEFTKMPVQILCVGQDFTYNHGIFDSNITSTGAMIDSFTYEWTDPLSGANSAIAYAGSYTYNKAIYFWGFPSDALPFPRGIHLDPQSGDILFRPMKAEVTVMVIKVNEFRNGTKIAEIRRDLQIIVITCTNNNPPLITTPNNVRSKSVCAGDSVTFDFTTNDQNAYDSVTLSWNNALHGASWTTTNGQVKHPTGTLTWIPTDANVSSLPYTFVVTAVDNACPVLASFSQAYQITVKPTPRANIIVTDSGCGVYWFMAQRIAGSGPSYLWSGDSFVFSPQTGPLIYHTFQPGIYPYTMTMTASGCSNTYYDSVFVDNFITVSLPADTAVCKNSTIALHASVSNIFIPYFLTWGSGDSIFHGDTTLIKQVTVSRDTTIWVRARYKNFDCPMDQINIKVHPDMKIILPDDTFFCDLSYSLTPQFSPNKQAFRSFKWFRHGSTLAVDSDAWLNVGDTGLFICFATDIFGCTYSDSVFIHLYPTPVININPIDKRCLNGAIISLNNFVTVDGIFRPGGIWTTPSAGLVYGDKFNPIAAGISSPPGWKVIYQYTNPTTGCYYKDSGYVTIYALPEPFAGNDDSICSGARIPLMGTPLLPPGSWRGIGVEGSYLNWWFNPDALGIVNRGRYALTYEYTDSNQCVNEDMIKITVFKIPVVEAGNPMGFCINVSSVNLTGNPAGGNWTGKGVIGNQFYPSLAGQGVQVLRYTYTNVLCTESDTVNVEVYPKTPTPVISLSPSDSFLVCNLTNGSFEWYYRNDTYSAPTAISNSTRRINPQLYCKKCYFSVVYTDTNGCVSDTSALFHFGVNSIDHNTRLSRFVFYPNPAHSELFIENPGIKPAIMLLTDIFGRTLVEKKIITGKNSISVQNYKPGIYLIFMDGISAGKLLIE